jgi:C4-dicarboxylate transporter
MHFRKLTSYVSLFFLPTLFALSVTSGNAATMTYDEFVEKVTSGIGQHLVRQVRDNEAIKEISPNFLS